MELKSLLIKDHSPRLNSLTSRNKVEGFFHFPTIDKCKSIEKLSINFSKKALEKSGKPKTLLVKQAMVEILSGIKDSTEKGLRLRLAFKALDCLAKDSGVFQKELSTITKELFEAVYCDKKQLSPVIKEWIYENYNFIACDQGNTMPLALILEFWEHSYKILQNAHNDLKQDLANLKEELEMKTEENHFLKSEMVSFKEMKLDSTKESSQETSTKEIPKEKYEKQIAGLNNIIEDLYSQLHFKENIIRELENNLKNKVNQCKSLEDRKKKYSENLKAVKGEFKNLKECSERMKEKIEKLECEKNKCDCQDQGVNLNLTCRPNYENCENLFDACADSSTSGRFRFLISMISSLKVKKLKKKSNTVSKKKIYTDLPTPYRKQQSYIIQ